MQTTLLFKALKAKSEKDSATRALTALVERVLEDCVQLAKSVVKYMPEYTLHDEVHLKQVAELMARLTPKNTLKRMTALEVAVLLLSAALHDIGMVPLEQEIASLVGDEKDLNTENRSRYRVFREGHPHLLERQADLRDQGFGTEAREIEGFILSEFLRQTHAERARDHIFDRYGETLTYGNYNFAARLASICYSHSQPACALDELPACELVRAPGEYCNWRFAAVLLRLADILDFDPKRTPPVLFEHLGIRSTVSIREWKKHQSISAWDIRPGRIAFAAQCRDPVIEKCVRDFIAQIERELAGARGVLRQMLNAEFPDQRRKYDLNLPDRVDVSGIGPFVNKHGAIYNYVDLAFRLDQERIMDLLMGVSLYADRSLFLRELIQNAVDACRHRSAIHRHRPALGTYAPQVTVRLLTKGGREFITVEDNGMGMDDQIIRNYFAQVGRSYYTSERFFEDLAKEGIAFSPVSQFGIGVLSVFMAGDQLNVETRRFGNASEPISIEIAGQGSLFWFRSGSRGSPGTEVALRLSHPSRRLFALSGSDESGAPTQPVLATSVLSLAPHVEFPITVEERSETFRVEAAWLLPTEFTPHGNLLEAVDVDLTKSGPSGLNGVARVFFVKESRFGLPFVLSTALPDPQLTRVMWDRLEHRFGHVKYVHVDSTLKEGLTERYSVEIEHRGRWSQQGFYVPYPLLRESARGRRAHPPTAAAVEFPLPVWYDLDLSGEFALSLSADRKSILPFDRTYATCNKIAKSLAIALFDTIGRERVRASLGFFESVARLNSGKAKPFSQALNRFLGGSISVPS